MTKLIPRYQHGNPFLIDRSSIPGMSPQTSSTISYDWNKQAEDREAIKQAEEERALQQYLDRRGYISEDKDKRSYTQRDVDDKINATKNAKTDFYSIGAPNAQSTDVTPRQVILPSLLAGFTAAAPLTSLATGAMYEPMEKYGLYKPVSLGLQKLGVNEKTAETLSPFITDPFIWSIPSLSKRLTNNNFTRSYVASRELNRGIKQATKQGDIRVPENYFHNPESVYRVTSPWERTTLQMTGQSTRADNSPIISLVRAHDPYYVKRRLFRKNPDNWVWTENGDVELDWKKSMKEVGIHKDAGHDHGVFGLNKGKTFYNSSTLSPGDVILETDGTGKFFRVGHHKNYSKPVEFSEDMSSANLDYIGRKTPPLALRDRDVQIPSQDFHYFEKMPDGSFKWDGRIFPEKRIQFSLRKNPEVPTLDEANEVATLKNDYNTFAQRYHYKHYHGPEDIQSLKQASQELADRHHTFFRGVSEPTIDLQRKLELNKLAAGEVAPGIPDQARLYKEGIDYNIRGLSPEVSDIVDQQIMPRLMEHRNFIANGIHVGDYYRNGINRRRKNVRISEWSNGMINDYNTLHNTSYGGWSHSDKPFIVINESMPKPLAETHEFRHQIQNETGPMVEEAKALREAYSDVPNPYSFDYDMRAEWETMNTEARTMLLRKAGYKYDPSLTVKENIEIQNKIIQDYPVEEMLNVLEEDASGYWSNYLKQNFKSGYKKVGEDKFEFFKRHIPEEKINAWKKAMQVVGVGSGVTYGINQNK